MEIHSLCPFQIGTLVWEGQPGQFTLTVVVKGTFVLAPGEAMVASEQDPLGDDRHWDNNALASLHRPSDFAPTKKRVDVSLVGHVYAPAMHNSSSVVARLRVGELDKAVRVTGDRLWVHRNGRLEEGHPAPFQRAALRYERARLAVDNPVGMDPNTAPALGMHAAPNLEPVLGSAPGVACFGPIAPGWGSRRKLLDDAGRFWAHGISGEARRAAVERGTAPRLSAPPAGFDFEFFNAAPRDQQLDLLRPGTPIVLEHLDPEHARLETRLPPHRPQVYRLAPWTTRPEEVAVRCDTLWIDCDRGVMVVLWRGLAEVVGPSTEEIGRVIVAADPEGKKLRFSTIQKRLGDEAFTTERLVRGQARPAGIEEPPDPMAMRHDGLKGAPAAAPIEPEEATTTHHLGAPEPSADAIADEPTTMVPPPPAAVIEDEATRSFAPREARVTLPLFPPPVIEPGPTLTVPFPDAPPEPVNTVPVPPMEDAATVRRVVGSTKATEIGVRDYARIQIALERGEVGRVLGELGLQLTDLVRLQRAWAVRLALKPGLSAELAEATEALRKEWP